MYGLRTIFLVGAISTLIAFFTTFGLTEPGVRSGKFSFRVFEGAQSAKIEFSRPDPHFSLRNPVRNAG